MRRLWCRVLGIVALTLMVAGCDKCGDRVKFNAPSIPKTCYGESQAK